MEHIFLFQSKVSSIDLTLPSQQSLDPHRMIRKGCPPESSGGHPFLIKDLGDHEIRSTLPSGLAWLSEKRNRETPYSPHSSG
jgi:hypothetical protein